MIRPIQQELPIAFIGGEAISEIPNNLYIPPSALRIILDDFQGPLDLLLYLIKRQNIDINRVNILEVTNQYLTYIENMDNFEITLSADYLLMSASLAEIKSRSLLPKLSMEDQESDVNPQADLIIKLRNYEKLKQLADQLNNCIIVGIDTINIEFPYQLDKKKPKVPDLNIDQISGVYNNLKQGKFFNKTKIDVFENLSTKDRMSEIILLLEFSERLLLSSCFKRNEGNAGLVVTLLAFLELVNLGRCHIFLDKTTAMPLLKKMN